MQDTSVLESNQQWFQENKLIQIGEMVAMIAHQWRQPLNALSASAINLILKVQMEEIDSDTVEKEALFIQNQCLKMSHMIETFMEFVKPSKEARTFTLRHALDQSLLLVERQLKHHNIVVRIEEISEGIEIFGYEDQFEQVVLNLISNAKDAFDASTQELKMLIIRLSRENGSCAVFSIEDNAGGIDRSIQDKIFDPYFTSKVDGKGTGLGLYMSQEIVKKSFDSELCYLPTDQGSRFEIRFHPQRTALDDHIPIDDCSSHSDQFVHELIHALDQGALSRAERIVDTLEESALKAWLMEKLAQIDFHSIKRWGERNVCIST